MPYPLRRRSDSPNAGSPPDTHVSPKSLDELHLRQSSDNPLVHENADVLVPYGARVGQRGLPAKYQGAVLNTPAPSVPPRDSRKADTHAAAATPVPKRGGKLPKHVTDLLKSWLLEHASHPYPTEEEKRDMCERTGLDICQVSNWFVNARRRILAPQAAAQNPSGSS
ncbi:homeodomain super [Malassezia sp. CBS 17886]|nr:homeodomain super [Malassezia sp. CBS 17886]